MANSELTMLHKLREIKNRKPNDDAFISYGESVGRRSLTFLEFHTLCRKFAHILKEEGVKPGEYVTVSLPVSLETVVATIGVVLTGAIPVSLDITFKDGEGVVQCMEKVKPRLVIMRDRADDNLLNFFKSGLTFSKEPKDTAALNWSRLPYLTKAYFVRRGGDNDFLTKLRNAKGEYEYEDIKGKMTAFVHYTTGTETDYLKMTEITHESAVRYYESAKSLFIKPFEKLLYINGFFWISALPFDIFHGIARCLPDCWEIVNDLPKLLYRIIKAENIVFADIHPMYLDAIMRIWKEDKPKDGPLFELLTIVGMPMSRRLLQRFKSLTQTFNLVYGSHECGGNHNNIIQASDVDQYTDFDCGLPMRTVETKIVDENWEPVPLGQKGRLLLKTPGMFKGYPNQPERTARRFDKDGWFITHDHSYYHKDTKHLMVGGRIDCLILHGEYMIYPSWIEEMVSPHPSVKQVISVPILDDVLFHSVGACVIKKPGCELTKEDIRKRLEEYLFDEKICIFEVKHLLFFDEFPLRDDGSVDRSRIFDIANERVHGKSLL